MHERNLRGHPEHFSSRFWRSLTRPAAAKFRAFRGVKSNAAVTNKSSRFFNLFFTWLVLARAGTPKRGCHESWAGQLGVVGHLFDDRPSQSYLNHSFAVVVGATFLALGRRIAVAVLGLKVL